MQRRLFVNRQISRAFRVDLHFVLSERRFIIIFFYFLFFIYFFFCFLLLLLFVLVGFFGVFGAAQFAFWATEVDKFFNLKSDARRTRVSLTEEGGQQRVKTSMNWRGETGGGTGGGTGVKIALH